MGLLNTESEESLASSVKIAPSILSADFARLGEQVCEAAEGGADWIHVDVMDGHFVPNLTFGPPVIKAIRGVTDLMFDVHLMIERPDLSIAQYVAAGADLITVHVETCPHLHRTLQQIREAGLKTGVTLNPATPVSALEPVIGEVDLVLVMSVNPGWGGQSYIPYSTKKISDIRARLDAIGSEAEIEVDGGVNESNLREVLDAGATVLVMGSAIFNDKASVADNLAKYKGIIDKQT
ncbi:MAG: ribulose-phosphate 3-epimerase [Planctomycetota bacterium]|nr:ribulose-phosphate 3-epimerase [Planctomycetota bacterium]